MTFSEGRLQGPMSMAGVEVYDYETDMWRVVIEFDTIAEALAWHDQSTDGRLIDACLAVDRTFTLGDDRVIDYAGNILQS
jgi:hypothetical protein